MTGCDVRDFLEGLGVTFVLSEARLVELPGLYDSACRRFAAVSGFRSRYVGGRIRPGFKTIGLIRRDCVNGLAKHSDR